MEREVEIDGVPGQAIVSVRSAPDAPKSNTKKRFRGTNICCGSFTVSAYAEISAVSLHVSYDISAGVLRIG
eukprot:2303041-Rhodomonas_salina.1